MTFLAPTLAFYALLTVYPVVQTLYNSLHVIRPGAPDEFIGVRNYIQLLSADATFVKAVVNTTIWAVVAPLIDLFVGLLLALLLYAGVPGSRFFRVAWFTPVLISYVVVAILWMWIYNYDWGAVNVLLRAARARRLGPGLARQSEHRARRADRRRCLEMGRLQHGRLPRGAPFAAVRGARGRRTRQLRLARKARLRHRADAPPDAAEPLVLAFIGKMKVFDLVWIMTKGGPLWATETVSTYVYKRAFEWNTFDLGYPSAIATVWFVVVLAPSLISDRGVPASATGWSTERCAMTDACGRRSAPAADAAVLAPTRPTRSGRSCGSRSCRCAPRARSWRDHYAWPATFHWEQVPDRLGQFRLQRPISGTRSSSSSSAVAIVTAGRRMAAHCLARYRFRRQPDHLLHPVLDDHLPAADHPHLALPDPRRIRPLRHAASA